MSIQSAWLVTNYTCNNNCSFCYARHTINKAHKIMDYNFACDVIDELVRIGVSNCILIGGEPTLYPNLPEIIKYGHKQKLRMAVVTNGRKLADKSYLAKLVNAGVSGINISLESTSKKDYISICAVDGFEDTVQGIKNCVEMGVPLSTCTTICSSNYLELVRIAKLAHSLGVKDIVLNFGIPSLDVSDGGDQYLPPRKLGEIAYKTFCILKECDIPHRFYGTIPLCSYSDKMRSEMLDAKVIPNITHCQLFPGSGIVFEPDGLVTPCTHWVNLGLFRASDENGRFSLKGKLYEKWMDVDGARMQFAKELERYPSNNCKLCSLWGKCIGGCPLLWNKFDPDENTKPVMK